MSVLVVGSVAFDSVKTPFGEVKDALGGSGTYFSVSASYFADVCLVAVVGEDFPDEHLNMLKSHKIDISGVEKRPGKTFRWKGYYEFDLNTAHTLDTQLNVFADFKPKLPENYRDCEYVFLANIDPELQALVLDQVKNPKLVACDTMNFWIEGKLDALKKTLERVDMLIINDGEARELANEPNIVKAARKIIDIGPKTLIIKRGEYGALMVDKDSIFSAPAYPLEFVFDPTGAGDTFAGGLMGYLSSNGTANEGVLRQGIIYGSTMASFNVEDFSLNRLRTLSRDEIDTRFRFFKKLTHFEDL
ncbi:MAG: sugar kinase [Nitrospinae bacterium]|nr:sugar kinase [Nitrospinota bacterium]